MEKLGVPANNKGFVRLVVIFLLLLVVAFGAFGIYTQIKGKNIGSPETQTGSNPIIKTDIPITNFVSGGVSVGYVDRNLIFNKDKDTKKLNLLLNDPLTQAAYAGSVDYTDGAASELFSGKTLVVFYMSQDLKSALAYDVLLGKSVKLFDSDESIRSVVYDDPRKSLLYTTYIYDALVHREKIKEYSLESKTSKVLYEVDGDTIEGFSISRDGGMVAYRHKHPNYKNWDGSVGGYTLAIRDLETDTVIKESTSSASPNSFSDISEWSFDNSAVYHSYMFPTEGGDQRPFQILKFELATLNDARITLNPDFISWGKPTFMSNMSSFVSVVFSTIGDTAVEGTNIHKIALYNEKECVKNSYKDNCHVRFYDNSEGAVDGGSLIVSPDQKTVYYLGKSDNAHSYRLNALDLESGGVRELCDLGIGLVKLAGWGTSGSELLILASASDGAGGWDLSVRGFDLNNPLGLKVYANIPNVYSSF